MKNKTSNIKSLRELSSLERRVMQIIWEKNKATSKEIKKALEPTKQLALSTILTILSRLEKKQYIKEIPSLGRSKVFKAVVPKESVAKNTVKGVLRHFFSGSPSALMAHLLKNEPIDDSEIMEIRQMLEARMQKEEKGEDEKC